MNESATDTPAPMPVTYAPPGFFGHIGIAREDITPPPGIYHRNWGAATHEVAEGIHAPLTLTVMTLQTNADAPPLILAAADLGWWRDPKDEKAFRQSILDLLGLDAAQFVLNFSHTHAGPALCRDDADKPGGHLIAPYLDQLRDSVAQAAQRALAKAEPCSLDFGYGKCGLATNRDFFSVQENRYICGYNPNAPADDTLLIGRISDANGGRVASLANYACHPTTLAFENRLISPDFVGMIRPTVEGEEGAREPCLFLQGASGELAPRLGYIAPRTGTPTEFVDVNGSMLAASIEATLRAMDGIPVGSRLRFQGVVESGAPLAIWDYEPYAYPSTLKAFCVDVELLLKPEWRGETEQERQWAAAGDAASLERLRRRRRTRIALTEASDGGATAKIPVWIWQIGDAFLVGHPNEAYSQLQIELRAAFPDTAIVVMNITNGWYGYLPPADCYGTDRYSVWQTPFDKGALEILIARCKEEIDKMRGASNERRSDTP